MNPTGFDGLIWAAGLGWLGGCTLFYCYLLGRLAMESIGSKSWLVAVCFSAIGMLIGGLVSMAYVVSVAGGLDDVISIAAGVGALLLAPAIAFVALAKGILSGPKQ